MTYEEIENRIKLFPERQIFEIVMLEEQNNYKVLHTKVGSLKKSQLSNAEKENFWTIEVTISPTQKHDQALIGDCVQSIEPTEIRFTSH